MNRQQLLVSVALGLGALGFVGRTPGTQLIAQTPGISLRGHVSSADEPVMEGVIVTARKAGAAMATSVVTDSGGEFQFSAIRLEPGTYSLAIRAAGYDLTNHGTVTIVAARTTVADLALEKTK